MPDRGWEPEKPFGETVRGWYDPAKVKPYAEHSPETQQALQRYWDDMAVDDGEWDGEDESERPLIDPQEPFGYSHVPMQSMTQALHQRLQNVDGYTTPSWDAYHQEYVGQGDTPNHGGSRWPVITSPDLVVDDGFHRLHDYYRQGDQTVPIVWSPEASGDGFWPPHVPDHLAAQMGEGRRPYDTYAQFRSANRTELAPLWEPEGQPQGWDF